MNTNCFRDIPRLPRSPWLAVIRPALSGARSEEDLARPRFPPVIAGRSRSRQNTGDSVPSHPETLGALKRSPFGVPERAFRSVKDEMRQNLLERLCQRGPLFAGVIGYEDTVMPQIVNAMLSRHNFILLGLRGQAKSRILRALVGLRDE